MPNPLTARRYQPTTARVRHANAVAPTPCEGSRHETHSTIAQDRLRVRGRSAPAIDGLLGSPGKAGAPAGAPALPGDPSSPSIAGALRPRTRRRSWAIVLCVSWRLPSHGVGATAFAWRTRAVVGWYRRAVSGFGMM